MSEIIKTEAVVLGKINYGDTSSITSLFTKDYGRLSAIVKGGRNPKSRIAHVIDPLNLVNVVFYKKDNRELQLLSSADLISHYPKIKENLEKLKYSYAVIELVKNLIPEHEANFKLFKGITRILELLDSSEESEKVIFGRFFIFFISLLGYEIQLDHCADCGKTIREAEDLSYNTQLGILCNNCRNKHPGSPLDPELFSCLKSLKFNKKAAAGEKIIDMSVSFLEQYLKTHIPDFKGLQSLKMFK